jgi:hypothetical protein
MKTDRLTGCGTGCIVGFFILYHEVRSKQGLWDLHHLSSAQQKHTKPPKKVHCYLQLKCCGKQKTIDLVTLDRQTALTVWHLHMNDNIESLGLPHAELDWSALTDRLKKFRIIP